MASVLKYVTNHVAFEAEIKRRNDLAESTRRVHFLAARKIQAWTRGILTRNHLRMLREKATTIQRHWRGHRGRATFDRYVIHRVHQMWQDHYESMATRIQAVWRGYWVRKTRVNLREVRRWLNAVYAKNQETVEDMKIFRRNEITHAKEVMEKESMLWILYILFKLHHLLRTKHRPGVLTRIDKTRFTLIEEMLKCFEYSLYVSREEANCQDCQIDPKPSLILRGTHLERCEKEIREFEKNLQAGKISILRSESYDDARSRTNQTYTSKNNSPHKSEGGKRSISRVPCNQRLVENDLSFKKNRTPQYVQRSATKSSCTSTNGKLPHIAPNELYNAIHNMDCHLNRLHLSCPIHNCTQSL